MIVCGVDCGVSAKAPRMATTPGPSVIASTHSASSSLRVSGDAAASRALRPS